MNQALEYFKAAVPDPWTILGLNLRPFSAGHLILLHRIESAFVAGGPINLDDLALSVLICSKTFEDGCALFNDLELNTFLVQWHEKLVEGGGLDFEEKVARFTEYMAEGQKCPGYIYKDGASEIGDVPTVQFVKAFVMSRMTMTESEFLNRPWALSVWDFLTLQAQGGSVRLCGSETVDDALDVAGKLAQLVKEGKIRCRS